MASTKNTFFSRFNGFVNLHAFLSEQNNKRVFPRRFHFPLKKKNNVADVSDLAYLFFKRSATNFFVTLFAHGKVLYSCSSGLVGLKKKQRRWSNAAFLIGSHFFTFIKHYLSVRSGTSVYRNKPLGNIVVVLRSPVYLFTLFYISFSRSYKKIITQIALRREISFRAAFGNLLLINSFNRSRKASASYFTILQNVFDGVVLNNKLYGARTCSFFYFIHRASWLQLSKYYSSSIVRSNAFLTHIFRHTLLRSTELMLPPMSGRLYPNKTTLGSFFSAYTNTSKFGIQSVQSFSNSIVPLCSTFFSIPSLFNTSFISLIGGVYFSYNTDTKIPLPFTHFLIDASKMNTLCFAQRYFQACVTFYIAFFFSLCTHGFNSNILVLSSRVYYSYLLSFFFFNIISTCMLATLSEVPYAQISFLRKNVVLPEWSVLYHNIFIVNGLIYISSFNSIYYDELCLLLRSGLLTYKLYNDVVPTKSYLKVFPKRSLFKALSNEFDILSVFIRSIRLLPCLRGYFFMKLVLNSKVYTVSFINDAFSSFQNIHLNVSDVEYAIQKGLFIFTNKATLLVNAYTKILRFYNRLASTYLNKNFYTKHLTSSGSPYFYEVSFLYNMLNRIVYNTSGKQRNCSIVRFIKSQLRTHRRDASTIITHLRRTTFFLEQSTRTYSCFFTSTTSGVYFAFQIAPYCKALVSKLLPSLICGNNSITSIVFTRAISSLYTVFFKRILLLDLHTKLFTYSFFFTPLSRSLSYTYFFSFFFSVFFLRGWTTCFVDTVSSSLLQNQVLNRLSDGFKLSVYKKASIFNDILGFHIFMFIDQSTFPFNGCKGKKKN